LPRSVGRRPTSASAPASGRRAPDVCAQPRARRRCWIALFFAEARRRPLRRCKRTVCPRAWARFGFRGAHDVPRRRRLARRRRERQLDREIRWGLRALERRATGVSDVDERHGPVSVPASRVIGSSALAAASRRHCPIRSVRTNRRHRGDSRVHLVLATAGLGLGRCRRVDDHAVAVLAAVRVVVRTSEKCSTPRLRRVERRMRPSRRRAARRRSRRVVTIAFHDGTQAVPLPIGLRAAARDDRRAERRVLSSAGARVGEPRFATPHRDGRRLRQYAAPRVTES